MEGGLAARGQRGFGGGSPDAASIITSFFQNVAFLGNLMLHFCFKRVFKLLKKCVDVPRSACLHFTALATPLCLAFQIKF